MYLAQYRPPLAGVPAVPQLMMGGGWRGRLCARGRGNRRAASLWVVGGSSLRNQILEGDQDPMHHHHAEY